MPHQPPNIILVQTSPNAQTPTTSDHAERSPNLITTSTVSSHCFPILGSVEAEIHEINTSYPEPGFASCGRWVSPLPSVQREEAPAPRYTAG